MSAEEVTRLLEEGKKEYAEDPKNVVYIISGRDQAFLEQHLGHIKGLGMSAEHGGFIREPGSSTWRNFTENLDMGCHGRRFPDKASYRTTLEYVFELFPRLAERRKQAGGTMSGGEQQMLAIGRALMARPELLLLDEPSMGLAPMVIQQIFGIIATIHEQGTTILLVEQNAQQALSRSDRGYVLETGSVTASGQGRALLGDPAIRAAYLGVA